MGPIAHKMETSGGNSSLLQISLEPVRNDGNSVRAPSNLLLDPCRQARDRATSTVSALSGGRPHQVFDHKANAGAPATASQYGQRTVREIGHDADSDITARSHDAPAR